MTPLSDFLTNSLDSRYGQSCLLILTIYLFHLIYGLLSRHVPGQILIWLIGARATQRTRLESVLMDEGKIIYNLFRAAHLLRLYIENVTNTQLLRSKVRYWQVTIS